MSQEARFRTAEKTHEHSLSPLKGNEVVLLLAYMGWRTSRDKVAEVQPKVDVEWVIAALLFNREDKILLLQVTCSVPTQMAQVERRGYYPSST